MQEVLIEASRRIRTGCRLDELLSYLRSVHSLKATPFFFVRVLFQGLGMPLSDARDALTLIDKDLFPDEAPDTEHRWQALIYPYVSRVDDDKVLALADRERVESDTE